MPNIACNFFRPSMEFQVKISIGISVKQAIFSTMYLYIKFYGICSKKNSMEFQVKILIRIYAKYTMQFFPTMIYHIIISFIIFKILFIEFRVKISIRIYAKQAIFSIIYYIQNSMEFEEKKKIHGSPSENFDKNF